MLLTALAGTDLVPFSTSESKCMLLPLARAGAHIAIISALHQIDIVGKHTGSAQSLVHKHTQTLCQFPLASVLAIDLVSAFG